MKQPKPSSNHSIAIATNNGDIGGGEVMLLNIAKAIAQSGRTVTVIAPSQPSAIADAAMAAGFEVEVLPAKDRISWVRALRTWRKANPKQPLWCNGLLPAFATSLMANRIVHLHQLPTGALKTAAAVALANSPTVLVPSAFMQRTFPQATVLPNWVPEVLPNRMPANAKNNNIRIGFIGRLTALKGIEVLARALAIAANHGLEAQLVIAGEARFSNAESDALVESSLQALGQRVTYLGWTTPADFLGQVDFVVIPSIAEETFGLVVAEAMSARVPFIISDAGALPEVAGREHQHTVRSDDATSLAFEIVRLTNQILDKSVDVKAKSDIAHERWSTHFSPEVGAKNVASLLDSLGY